VRNIGPEIIALIWLWSIILIQQMISLLSKQNVQIIWFHSHSAFCPLHSHIKKGLRHKEARSQLERVFHPLYILCCVFCCVLTDRVKERHVRAALCLANFVERATRPPRARARDSIKSNLITPSAPRTCNGNNCSLFITYTTRATVAAPGSECGLEHAQVHPCNYIVTTF